MHVDVKANQILDVGGQQVMRMFVKTKAQADRSRQALGVLMKTHEDATGAKVKVVNISIEDGSEVTPSSPQKKTIEKYKVMIDAMSKGHFEAKPSSFSCPTCPFFMYCDQGQR